MGNANVLCDGEDFEFDIMVPAGNFRPLVLQGIVAAASAVGTGFSHDLYILPRETGKWAMHGTDGLVHDLEASEPVYVKLKETKPLTEKIEAIQAALKQYS